MLVIVALRPVVAAIQLSGVDDNFISPYCVLDSKALCNRNFLVAWTLY